jgi:hypothetical protein
MTRCLMPAISGQPAVSLPISSLGHCRSRSGGPGGQNAPERQDLRQGAGCRRNAWAKRRPLVWGELVKFVFVRGLPSPIENQREGSIQHHRSGRPRLMAAVRNGALVLEPTGIARRSAARLGANLSSRRTPKARRTVVMKFRPELIHDGNLNGRDTKCLIPFALHSSKSLSIIPGTAGMRRTTRRVRRRHSLPGTFRGTSRLWQTGPEWRLRLSERKSLEYDWLYAAP